MINISALGFADGIVLITDSRKKLQNLLDICHSWASNNKMSYNISKCKVMMFNGPFKDTTFTLNNEILKTVNVYKYLGITLSSKYITNLFRQHYTSISEKANIKASIISRHGFHEDGLRLNTAIKLYKLVIRPVLEYCAQTLTYNRYNRQPPIAEPCDFAIKLEHLQTQILKKLINCHRSTSPAIVRLFCGIEPLSCRFDILKLRYFWRILKCTPKGLPCRVLEYRRTNFQKFNKGFAHEVFHICNKYNIPYLWHGNTGNHKNPLRAINKIIKSQNLTRDLRIGRGRKCAFATTFLQDPTEYTKDYHLPEIFCKPDCFETPNGRKRVVKALLHPCSYEEGCSFCDQTYKDKLNHYLAVCPRILNHRKQILQELKFYNFPAHHLPMERSYFLRLTLQNRIWRKCLVKFLVDTDF